MEKISESTIQPHVQRIVDAFHPLCIALFGSYANGTASVESDVDLLVIMNTPLRPVRQAFEIRRKISFPFPVDLIVRTPEQINQRRVLGDPFILEILAKGKVLYEAA